MLPRIDFTLDIYTELLKSLIQKKYYITSYESDLIHDYEKVVILRHDVDKNPLNSLTTARIENSLGVKATYYFRIVKESNDKNVINKIKNLGHEIGYHYEDLALARGDFDLAIKSFNNNLQYFRQFYPVKTICMHGNPTSKWDNKLIWTKFNYKDFGILGEPYFDIDFNTFAYFTDTGRSWNGEKVSIRDKVKNNHNQPHAKSTFDLIKLINEDMLQDKIMITTHPQRWNNNLLEWGYEIVSQNVKNLVKRIIIKSLNRGAIAN